MFAPTSVLCAIPGLIWPATGLPEALDSLSLPGLSALLAHARVRHAAPCSLDRWLAAQFGLIKTPPYAALRLAGEQDAAPDADTSWVCADPIGLRFARQHLLLDGPATVNPQQEEMASLFDDLNKTFADVGKFLFTSSQHGYIVLDTAHADKFDVTLAPLSDAENRPVAHFQPQGGHANWWSRLSNELQVFCHNHPVNVAREARGAPALNGLWLWGAGRSPLKLMSPAAQIGARLVKPQPLLAGLASMAQISVERFRCAASRRLAVIRCAPPTRTTARHARLAESLANTRCRSIYAVVTTVARTHDHTFDHRLTGRYHPGQLRYQPCAALADMAQPCRQDSLVRRTR